MKRLQMLMEIAIFASLGVVFDLLIPFKMPQGGSISLAMLPIFVMAFRHGVVGGVVTGALVGTIQLMFAPQILTVVQPLLDYTIAFGVVGLSGLFARQVKKAAADGKNGRLMTIVLIATLLGAGLRYVCHVISGIVFFAEYAEGPVVPYSLIYNATYMVPSYLLCGIVAGLLFTTAPRLLRYSARGV
ncbi:MULTISPECIES: energy-coupled thiamine transporter ThiT [Exiguobacterium]|uniref:Energy-coupled thiamine transporter ThiT n=1 Tax=Exiguobacterium antarcticum TaxID=132920 RepID=A0ABT6QZ37_9BACL|nr:MULTISPECIES: energy-coupled thiamine transporter ThiT [Exiguobacterium]AFS70878.1 Thiamine transporter ThiT [Exiguobacterium antarcticum B7]MDI3233808.1 energy-coupled thiamine transporter ThiT [Exiguobacterium antarcticum]